MAPIFLLKLPFLSSYGTVILFLCTTLSFLGRWEVCVCPRGITRVIPPSLPPSNPRVLKYRIWVGRDLKTHLVPAPNKSNPSSGPTALLVVLHLRWCSPVKTDAVGFTRLCSKVIKAKDGCQRPGLDALGTLGTPGIPALAGLVCSAGGLVCGKVTPTNFLGLWCER